VSNFPAKPGAVKKDTQRVNRMIRVPEVRVVGVDGGQVGVLPTPEALRMAEDAGLDLVEISPNAEPPVCRIMDYGKYKYQLNKKAHEAKKKQTVIHIKEVKFRTRTEEHDFQFKLRNIRKFIEHGDKVKIAVYYRGREMAHPELGMAMLTKVTEAVKDIAVVEQPAKLEGKRLGMMVGPSSQK